jgi:hypothetical protein
LGVLAIEDFNETTKLGLLSRGEEERPGKAV